MTWRNPYPHELKWEPLVIGGKEWSEFLADDWNPEKQLLVPIEHALRIRAGAREACRRLREQVKRSETQRDRALDLHEESFARWDAADRELSSARARISELEQAIIRIHDAVGRHNACGTDPKVLEACALSGIADLKMASHEGDEERSRLEKHIAEFEAAAGRPRRRP